LTMHGYLSTTITVNAKFYHLWLLAIDKWITPFTLEVACNPLCVHAQPM